MTGEELSPREVDVQRLMGDALPEIEDAEEVRRALLDRILSADDLKGLFRDTSTIATRDLIGRTLEVRGCRIMQSNLEGSSGVYMLLDAVLLEDGELVTVNTGAPNVMGVVYRAHQLGLLPIEVEVIEVARARDGRSAPLGLRPIGKTLAALGGVKGGK